jgi:hypothetical protein
VRSIAAYEAGTDMPLGRACAISSVLGISLDALVTTRESM